MREILGVFEVFLGIFEKTKEKKDRVSFSLDVSNRAVRITDRYRS